MFFGMDGEKFEDVKVLMWMIVLDDKFWELGWFWVLDIFVEEVWRNEGKF